MRGIELRLFFHALTLIPFALFASGLLLDHVGQVFHRVVPGLSGHGQSPAEILLCVSCRRRAGKLLEYPGSDKLSQDSLPQRLAG